MFSGTAIAQRCPALSLLRTPNDGYPHCIAKNTETPQPKQKIFNGTTSSNVSSLERSTWEHRTEVIALNFLLLLRCQALPIHKHLRMVCNDEKELPGRPKCSKNVHSSTNYFQRLRSLAKRGVETTTTHCLFPGPTCSRNITAVER